MEPKINIIKSQKNKPQIIIDNTYIFNYDGELKNDTRKFRCRNYRNHNPRCPAYVIIDKENKIIKSNFYHLCKGNSNKIEIKEARETICKEIENASNKFDLKPKNLFKDYIEKHTKVKVSFGNIKSSLYNNINAKIPEDVDSFQDLPHESIYYYMSNGEKFVIYQDDDLLLMQTKLLSKILWRFPDEVFMDGTFFAAPKLSYQLVVVRVYANPLKKYFTVAFGLMQNKTKDLYIKLYKKIQEKINKNIETNNNKGRFTIKNFHCDYEEGLYQAALTVFPQINIKFCYWNFQQLMEKRRKKFLAEYTNYQEVRELFKRVITLPFIVTMFIKDVFNKIKEDTENLPDCIKEFIIYL